MAFKSCDDGAIAYLEQRWSGHRTKLDSAQAARLTLPACINTN